MDSCLSGYGTAYAATSAGMTDVEGLNPPIPHAFGIFLLFLRGGMKDRKTKDESEILKQVQNDKL